MSAEEPRIDLERLASMSRREIVAFLEALRAPVPEETWRALDQLLALESAPEVQSGVQRARRRLQGGSAAAPPEEDPDHVDLAPVRALVRSLLIFVTILGSWVLDPRAVLAQQVQLDLASDPPGAATYLDEKPLGRTPLQRSITVSCIPRLLRFERAGHLPRVEAVGRSEGIGLPMKRAVSLAPRSSRVILESIPPAMVLKDQSPLGKTPLEIEVTGELALELLSPGHYPEPVTLVAGPGSRKVVHLLSEGAVGAASSVRSTALARQLLGSGDLPRAVEVLQALHVEQPDSPHHVDLLMHVLLRATFFEEAARLVETAAALDAHPGWIASLASECLDAGTPVGPLEAAMEKVPATRDESYTRTMARIELARGRPGEALDLLALLDVTDGETSARVANALLRVRARHDLRDIQQLGVALLHAVGAGADPIECWTSLQFLAQRSGERGIFVALQDQATGSPPTANVPSTDPALRAHLDQILASLRALSANEFSRALEEGRSLPPGKARALIQSEVQLGRKDPRAALFVLAPAWEDASAGGAAALTLARIYAELGDPEAAASLRRRLRVEDLTYRQKLLEEAREHVEAGASREALATLVRLRATHPRALGQKEIRMEIQDLLPRFLDPLLSARDVMSITSWVEEWRAARAPADPVPAGGAADPALSRSIELLIAAVTRIESFREAILAHSWDTAEECDAALTASGVIPLGPFLAMAPLPGPLEDWAKRSLGGGVIGPLRAALLEARFEDALRKNDHREAARQAWKMIEQQPDRVRPHLLWILCWVAVLAPYGLTMIMILLVGSALRGSRRDRRRRFVMQEIEECVSRAEHQRLRDLWNITPRADLPADSALRVRIAGFLAEGGHLEMADKLLESVPSVHRESWAGIRTRLRILSARKEHVTAVTFLKRAISSPGWELPSIEEMLEVQVEVLMAAGEGPVAAEHVRQALQHPTRPRLRPALAERVMDLLAENGDLEAFVQFLRMSPNRRLGSAERLKNWIELIEQRGGESREARLCRVVLNVQAGRLREAVEALRKLEGHLPGPADVELMLETIRGTTSEDWFTDAIAALADGALDRRDTDDGTFLTFARHLETHGRPWEAYRCLLRIAPDSFKFPSVLPRIRTLARLCLEAGKPVLAVLMQRHLIRHGQSLDPEETFLTKLAAGELPPPEELPAGRVARTSYASLRERLLEELRAAHLEHLLASGGETPAGLVLPHRLEPNRFQPPPEQDPSGSIESWSRELAASSLRLDHPAFPVLRAARGGAGIPGRVALALELTAGGAKAAAFDLIRDWRSWYRDLAPEERDRVGADIEQVRSRCLDDASTTGGSVKHTAPFEHEKSHVLDALDRRFPIHHLSGRTARSVVYLAEDPEKGPVALKVFPLIASGPGSGHDGHRLLKGARIDLRYLVKVHQVGEDEGHRWVVMEHVPGTDLSEVLRTDGRLDAARVRVVARGILIALEAIHRAGLVHGDLSAANVRLAGPDRAVVLDPGSVHRIGERAAAGTWTLRYAAPELLQGRPAGEGADLFSVAALAYHLGTGHPPFPGSNVTEVSRAIEKGAVPPVCRSRGFDPRLEDWVLRSLHPDPCRRHATATEMLGELEAT